MLFLNKLSSSTYILLAFAVVLAQPSSSARLSGSHAVNAPVSSKAGLAWPLNHSGDINTFQAPTTVNWYYAFGPHPVNEPTSLEFVPQLANAGQTSDWSSTIQSTISAHGVGSVLGFDQPNSPSGADLTPEDAAALWQQFIQPLHSQGIRLGSPGTLGPGSSATSWLQSFLEFCSGCNIDFIALQWFGSDAQDFIDYLEEAQSVGGGRPIWVTQWGCEDFNGGEGCSTDNTTFVDTARDFMESSSFVERYAWLEFP